MISTPPLNLVAYKSLLVATLRDLCPPLTTLVFAALDGLYKTDCIKACAKTVFIGFGILFQASFPLFAISRITSTIESRDMSVCSTPPLKTACLTAEDTTSSIPESG